MRYVLSGILVMCLAGGVWAQEQTVEADAATQPATTQATTEPAGARLPHIYVDVKNKQVRVACEALEVEMLLEFLCVGFGGPEHESILRTRALASHIHLGLLMIGLEPGEPVRYDEQAQKWLPPTGPAVKISVEFEQDGKVVRYAANRLMRHATTKKEAPEMKWVFCGSRIMEDGKYAADITGYIVTVVNFDLSLIDVPYMASRDNETLEWERNPDHAPKMGTKVTMILEPGEPKADK